MTPRFRIFAIFVEVAYGSQPQSKEQIMTKRNNTIAIPGTDNELDRAAASLTMDDFFMAVKDIRNEGVLFEDEEHGGFYAIHVNPVELHAYDPELCEPDDSLESILYGVFMAVKDPGRKGCETRSSFDESWKWFATDRKFKKDKDRWAFMALYRTLTGWLRFFMEKAMEEQVKHITEEDVLKRIEEVENGQKVN